MYCIYSTSIYVTVIHGYLQYLCTYLHTYPPTYLMHERGLLEKSFFVLSLGFPAACSNYESYTGKFIPYLQYLLHVGTYIPTIPILCHTCTLKTLLTHRYRCAASRFFHGGWLDSAVRFVSTYCTRTHTHTWHLSVSFLPWRSVAPQCRQVGTVCQPVRSAQPANQPTNQPTNSSSLSPCATHPPTNAHGTIAQTQRLAAAVLDPRVTCSCVHMYSYVLYMCTLSIQTCTCPIGGLHMECTKGAYM